MKENNNFSVTENGFHSQTNNHGNGWDNASINYIADMSIPSLAFVLYCPSGKVKKNTLYYNNEAFNVLSRISPPSNDGKALSSYGTSLCSNWKDLLDKKDEMISESAIRRNFDTNSGADYFDMLKSHRRRYGVRGTILVPQIPVRQKQDKHYLFIMERICNYPNLPMFFRMWDLNRCEREIVELLFQGLCNKEMARAIGLSANTVKMYINPSSTSKNRISCNTWRLQFSPFIFRHYIFEFS